MRRTSFALCGQIKCNHVAGIKSLRSWDFMQGVAISLSAPMLCGKPSQSASLSTWPSGECGMDQVLLAPTCHATKAAATIILHTPVFKP